MTTPLMPAGEDHFTTLDRTPYSAEDHALALRHAPRIHFDAKEPFLPLAVGYTIFREEGHSPSFPRTITLTPGVATAIEYAVWWDWDIGHLYELEHIWVYLDAQEQLVDGEASWHGGYHQMRDEHGQFPLEQGRLVVHSEPGKHAFAPSPAWLLERAPRTTASCTTHAGKMGVHVTPLFEGLIKDRTPLNNRLVHSYLERQVFQPAFAFTLVVALETVTHVPWPNLFTWIPKRISWWVKTLDQHIPPGLRRVVRIAHRGASASAQENSQSAIRRAAELGADMVEVDVRLTADHMPVISHDESLKRVYGIEGSISDFTLDALRAATSSSGQEAVMSFAELADLCDDLRLGLYLDIKQVNPAGVLRILNTLKRHGMLKATIFGSFRPDWLADLKAVEPEVLTSILFSSVHVDPVPLAKAIGCDYVHPCWERFAAPHVFLTEQWIAAVRAADLGIVCWHEERPEEIRALQALGVDAICSDEPELLVQHLFTGRV